MILKNIAKNIQKTFCKEASESLADSFPRDSSPPPIVRPVWNHPWLQPQNITRFAAYSAEARQFALAYAAGRTAPLRISFCNNMAQNMYKWACMAHRAGHAVELQCRGDDGCVLSLPEWEEFDGEETDLFSPSWPQEIGRHIPVKVPRRTVAPAGDSELSTAWTSFVWERDYVPLMAKFRESGVPILPFLLRAELHVYLSLCEHMRQADVIFSAADHIPSLLSGRPYNVFLTGGDADIMCSRRDWHGAVQRIAMGQARFLHLSNPHMLGHCRRMGWANAVHAPYPMDDAKYCPGQGQARRQWESELGPGCYVLTTARIDSEVKGNTPAWLEALCEAARRESSLRFVFLQWGASAEAIRQRCAGSVLDGRLLFLKPAGKLRLIDYYRSCDVVMDQFTYGYYGATGLEAAACGRPLVMFLRQEHYAPLYHGDAAPVENCSDPAQLPEILVRLARDAAERARQGAAMRAWLVRNHGEAVAGSIMLALLRLAAEHVPLPQDLVSPLTDPLSEEEQLFNAEYENW